MALSQGAGRGMSLGPFLGVSLGLHVVALVVMIVAGMLKGPSAPPPDLSIKTRLVKLGKKRDEKLLPRKVKPKPKPKAPKPKAPPPPVKEPPKAEPPPKPEPPKPKPEPKVDSKQVMSDALSKLAAEPEPEAKRPNLSDLIKDTIDEGHEDGSKIGEEIEGRLKATFNDKILARIKNALKVPATIEDAERLRLKARLYVAIGPAGEVLSAKIRKSSGNPAFDNAVLAAAKKSDPFPAPPIQVRAFYRTGVQMNVCPISCR